MSAPDEKPRPKRDDHPLLPALWWVPFGAVWPILALIIWLGTSVSVWVAIGLAVAASSAMIGIVAAVVIIIAGDD